jgi:hypothetical protein
MPRKTNWCILFINGNGMSALLRQDVHSIAYRQEENGTRAILCAWGPEHEWPALKQAFFNKTLH